MTVYEFHTAIDEFLKKSLAHSPPEMQPVCHRCTLAYCCSEPAYSTDLEVGAMLEQLTPEETEIVRANTKVWMEKFAPFKDIDMPAAFPYRDANIPCPLLSADNRCMAYAQRPGDCRLFLAHGEPENCAMPMRKKQQIADWAEPKPFWPIMARFTIDNLPLTMDHIGAHLVRRLVDPTYETGATNRIERDEEEQP